MLKMSKDHRSAGLWWSLLLSGGSLGGHGNFLSLFSSSFVFFMTSCHIWSCDGRFCGSVYRDHWTMRSFSHGGLCLSLGKDNEQCCIWLICCLPCLLHHFIFLNSCCGRRCCGRRFCERIYRDRWSMRRTNFILQLWGLEIRCSAWKRAILSSFSSFLVSAGAAADHFSGRQIPWLLVNGKA